MTALSSLTELLSGYLKEDLKNLFKPSALVAAAIFAALQLLLVFPPLIKMQFPPVLLLLGMPAIWQVFMILLVIVVLGYIINSLGGVFLGLVSGSAFGDSPFIGKLYLKIQKSGWQDLQDDANSLDKTVRERAQYRLSTQYPKNVEDLGLTRLGNILAATSSYTFEQYGAHLETLWPTMSAVLTEEDASLGKRIGENRESLFFLTSLTILLILIMLEFGLAWLASGEWRNALWTLVLLLLVYATYAAASQKALAWSRDVRTAFDLYLDEVATKFELRELPKKEFDKRKTRWEEFSRWLIYPREGQSDWYEAPSAVQPSVTHPPSVTVQNMIWKLEESGQGKTGRTYKYGGKAHYLFSITNEESGEHAKPAQGVYLVVEDKRLPELKPVEGELKEPKGNPTEDSTKISGDVQGEKEPKLVWFIGDVPVKSSRLLEYDTNWIEVEITLTNAEFDGDPAIDTATGLVEIKMIRNAGSGDLAVYVELPQDEHLPEWGALIADKKKGMLDSITNKKENSALWNVADLVPGTSLTLKFLRTIG